jgi:hypothetical protein
MNLAAEETYRLGDPLQVGHHLNELLKNEIKGSESRRKSVLSLVRVWARVPEPQFELQKRGLGLYLDSNTEEKIWLHWGMSIAAFPIFVDVALTIGKLLKLQAYITSGQVHREIYSKWGQRSTLQKAVQSILISMKDWGTLTYDEKLRRYEQGARFSAQTIEIQKWLLEILLFSNNTQINISQINNNPLTYPFKFNINITDIINSNEFIINSYHNEDSFIKLRV